MLSGSHAPLLRKNSAGRARVGSAYGGQLVHAHRRFHALDENLVDVADFNEILGFLVRVSAVQMRTQVGVDHLTGVDAHVQWRYAETAIN